jgi:hypothetical protein
VARNKGTPGVNEVTVAEFEEWLNVRWPSAKEALLGIGRDGGHAAGRALVAAPANILRRVARERVIRGIRLFPTGSASSCGSGAVARWGTRSRR